MMFDNRIATLENTRQVLLCKCTERFARENVNRGGGELEIGLLSQIEISDSKFQIQSHWRLSRKVFNRKSKTVSKSEIQIGNRQ